jgi:hypothetical protein
MKRAARSALPAPALVTVKQLEAMPNLVREHLNAHFSMTLVDRPKHLRDRY